MKDDGVCPTYLKTICPPHQGDPCVYCGKKDGVVSIADETWKKGFLHLTVDGDGLVSLWDHEMNVVSYVKLQLTPEQMKTIEDTMKKGGPTP